VSLLRLPTEDRRILERIILPYFAARPEYGRVLFVGCSWYTRAYASMFRERQYSTMDIDPAKARWGAPHRHYCESLTRVDGLFGEASLDLIVCNGVFGWGLDEEAEVEAAFRGCHACLRPDGILILGWNDVPAHRPFPPEQSRALQMFSPFRFPPLDSSRHQTATRNRHTYGFYVREAGARRVVR